MDTLLYQLAVTVWEYVLPAKMADVLIVILPAMVKAPPAVFVLLPDTIKLP